MGIDYGERKIGIALSDSLQLIAYPYKTIDRKKTPVKDFMDSFRDQISSAFYPIANGY